MQFDTLIQGGTVVTAADTYAADIGISGGRITAIAQQLPRETARQVLSAQGLYVMPGGIDVHTHLDMPFGGTTSADDFESGTIAAAFGGTTTLIDFAIQYKGQTLRTAFDTWMKKAERKATIDYASTASSPTCPTPAWTTWTPWCAKASPASSSSWPTPACSCWKTP